MIELDIKIRAENQDTVKLFTDLMITGLSAANQMGQVDVTLTAEKDGDKITLIRKEIVKHDSIVTLEDNHFTPIEDFIAKSDLSLRSIKVLRGNQYNHGHIRQANILPFQFAEDITQGRFLSCKYAGRKSWDEVEAELKRQNIKY